MAYPAYIRDKARELRATRKLTIDELAERLSLSRTSIYYWVRDIPIPRRTEQTAKQRRGTRVMQAKYRRLRDEAYEEGRRTFSALARDPTFRDFINLYIAEGYKRDRNQVSLCNSDPVVVLLANRWIRRLGANKVAYSIQYHADQDLQAVRQFWATTLGIQPSAVTFQRKSNSAQLAGRNWRSRHGVLDVRCCDTLLRARLEGWMDCLREQWLHSLETGRGAAW